LTGLALLSAYLGDAVRSSRAVADAHERCGDHKHADDNTADIHGSPAVGNRLEDTALGRSRNDFENIGEQAGGQLGALVAQLSEQAKQAAIADEVRLAGETARQVRTHIIAQALVKGDR
jgi:hypothetical protein